MISPQALIDPGAKIGKNVKIYPFAYIEDNVEIDDECVIYPFVSIMKGTRLGKRNIVYQNAVIGAIPQDFFWKEEPTEVFIGNQNIIRENVIISRATDKNNPSRIGNKNTFMESTHISHNVTVGDHCIFGYGVKIASECQISNNVIFSSNVIAKPQCRIGEMAFILSGCRFGADIPPYITAKNNPIEYGGINARHLSHENISDKIQRHIANAYRLVFNSKSSLYDSILQIEDQVQDSPEIQNILEFLKSSKGIITKSNEQM